MFTFLCNDGLQANKRTTCNFLVCFSERHTSLQPVFIVSGVSHLSHESTI